MSLKGKMGALVSRNRKDPADFVFDGKHSIDGYLIFEDVSIGTIQEDMDFDVLEFMDEDEIDYEMYKLIDDWKYDLLKGNKKKMVENFIKDQCGGNLPIGSIYIDKWYPDGTSYEGGCYVNYKGETLKDWCDRNNEWRPIMDAPDEAVEMLDNEDWEGLERFFDIISGMER